METNLQAFCLSMAKEFTYVHIYVYRHIYLYMHMACHPSSMMLRTNENIRRSYLAGVPCIFICSLYLWYHQKTKIHILSLRMCRRKVCGIVLVCALVSYLCMCTRIYDFTWRHTCIYACCRRYVYIRNQRARRRITKFVETVPNNQNLKLRTPVHEHIP